MESLRTKSARTLWMRAAVALCGAGVAAFALWRATPSPPEIPIDAMLVADGWADEQTCAECHAEAETFWETGHALTLQPATSETSRAALKALVEVDAPALEGTRIEMTENHIRAVHSINGQDRELPLDWCFGSGTHARTWVGTLADSWGATDLIEFRWTWYHETQGFDITPGQPDQPGAGYFGALGLSFDPPKTQRCFACHATSMSVHEGRIDESTIHAGVTCQRCHGPRARHVATKGEVIDGFWRDADQHEAVRRCAQCHRRADEQEPEDIRTDNPEIVRFQPVGLVQSACFQASPAMTCTTCHDPHQLLSAQDSLGIWQCVQCHDPAHPEHTTCAAGHADDCLTCHMPRVAFYRPLKFTDHWIRVRDAEETPP